MTLAGSIEFEFTYLNAPIPPNQYIYKQVRDFYNFLVSEESAVITDCPDFDRLLMVSIIVYHDSQDVDESSPSMQLSCRLGTETL